jgi:TrmH family RNA methyltransferase
VPDPLRVVLVSPRNPLNIGAAARAMSNFGFSELRLVTPYEVAFREARSAVHSAHILAEARTFETLAPAISDCTLVVGTTAAERRDLHLPLYRLEAGAALLKEHIASGGSAAIVFGCEKSGLSNQDMSHCHWLMRIPARKEHGSMNLGQAVAICLYEMRREESEAQPRFGPPERAPAEAYERMTALLADILARSGYVQERTSASSELKIRRLMRRLTIPASDVETWLGILRQILWKVKQNGT